MGNGWFGPRMWYGDQAYHNHQRELVDALTELQGFDVIFKLHHKERTQNPISSYIERTGADVTVKQDTPFTKVVSQADIVLNDWPHTAFLEAMLYGRPIVYLDIGWTDWTEEGRRLLESSLPVVRTTSGWQDRLRETLEAVASGATSCQYDRFLSTFCQPGFDGTPLWEYLQS
ncbi:hypothetical protein VB773_02065 [Haloarculaceae archaeon H-GB2-1]|nr:hypothetical protein [Haloarculaceae archaeon H-GB2-1]